MVGVPAVASNVANNVLASRPAAIIARANANAQRQASQAQISSASRGVALAFKLNAPRLGRIGQRSTVTANAVDAFGHQLITPCMLFTHVNQTGLTEELC